jgi:uncharacterized protein YbaR (Trm112 family)
MALDAKLLEILACPNCHGEVEYKEAEQVIECRPVPLPVPGARRHPVMLIEEAEKPGTSPS